MNGQAERRSRHTVLALTRAIERPHRGILRAEPHRRRADQRQPGHPEQALAQLPEADPVVRELLPAQLYHHGGHDSATDIHTRPFSANWVDSAPVVTNHNSGGGGPGTETWYDATTGH